MSLRSVAGEYLRRVFPSRCVPQVAREVRHVSGRLDQMERRLRSMQEALGRIEGRQNAERSATTLSDAEFRVYSQWGEDGIIQHLCRHVPIERKLFVEFGVESYEEANTRFLMINNNWAGLVLDADGAQIARIRGSREYWLYNLKAEQAFITRDNINRLLEENAVTGPIGLLSIDIDGMDYWIWDAMRVVDPAIVVVEYNFRLGIEDAVTVPYRVDFDRRKAHHSILYYGASLKALCRLAERKGYDFVGTGSHGLNAFFVRKSLRPEAVPALSPEEGYRVGQFCEAHDASGTRIKMAHEEQCRLVRSLPLVNVDAPDAGAGEGV